MIEKQRKKINVMHLTKVYVESGTTLFDIIDHNMGNNSNGLVTKVEV